MAEQFVPMQTASGELFVPQHIASANKPLEVANAQNLSASIKDFNQNLSPDMRFGSFRNESSKQARIDQQNETKEHQLESLRNSLSDASVAQKLHEQSSLLESTLPKVGRRPSQAPSLAGGHHVEQMGIDPSVVPSSLRKDIAKVARSGEKLSDTPLLQPNSAKQLNRTPAPAFDIASIQEQPVPEQAQTPASDIYDTWSDVEHLHPEDDSKPKPLDARDIEEMFSDVNIPNNDENVAPTSNGLVDVWSDVDSALPQDDESELVGTNALPGLHPDSNWHAEDDNEQREITHDEQADVHSPEEPLSEIPQATASQLPDILPANSDWFDDTAQLSEAVMNPDAPVRRQIPDHLLKRSREARQRFVEQARPAEATRQTDVVASAPNPTDTNNPADTEINADEPSLGDSILSIWKKFIDSRKDMKVLEENKGELFDLASNTISQALTEKNPFPDLDRDEILSVFDVLRPYLLSIFTDVVTGATGQQTVLSMNEGSVNYIFNKIMNLNKEEFPELDQTSPEDDTIAGKFDDSDDDTIASGNFIANNTNTDEDDVVVASFISDTNGVATNADKPTAPTTGIEADPPVPSPSIVDKKLGSLVTRKTILNPVKIKTTVAAWKDGQASASTEPTLARNIGVRVGRSRAIRAITNVLDKPLSANELESLTEYEQKQAEIQSKKYEDEAKRDSNIKPKRNTQTEEPKSDDKKESKPLEATVVASKEISVDEFLRGLDDDERNEVSKLPYSTLQKLANASTK